MPKIEIHTYIEANKQICFDLARNIDFHQESLKHSNEKAISGKTSGLIGLGESVTWEAKHFGFTQILTSKITEFESPNYFVDEMVSGAFKSFRHLHIFQQKRKQTLMIDEFYFQSSFGFLGKLANRLFLEKYIINLLKIRNQLLKEVAEKAQTLNEGH